ncbi:MAG: TonB-dependent receptor [Bacteroidetes bacterium]|nr:TonB-dependent receptor [Bacteroidota bacterium]
MNNFVFRIATILLCVLVSTSLYAQDIQLKGKITDKKTKEGLIGANVQIKGTNYGAITDIDGNYEITANVTLPYTLVVSYLGYAEQEIQVTSANQTVDAALDEQIINVGNEVVISASRVSERIQTSPSSIQKLNSRQIQAAASGNFYQSLGNLKEVDMTTSSMGFQVFNTRGFNTTAPVRIVQFIDGMDNQAPGLNFPVGNLVGANDLDLQSVEVISGAASALYGANAFQGVLSMQSKNPFDFKNLQVKIKGGNRQLVDAQLRYANAFGKKKYGRDVFGFKVSGSFFRANDWVADDTIANLYGDIETDVNVSTVVRKLQYDDDTAIARQFRALNAYLDFFPNALPGIVHVKTPGYMEHDLTDNKTRSIKANIALYARPIKDMQLEYQYKFGLGSAVYQGANRYNVKDILFQQHKVQLDYKGFTFKYYSTLENAGKSYDMVFSAINLSKVGISRYISNFIKSYFSKLSDYTNEFKDDPQNADVLTSREFALQEAFNNAYLQPGTYSFDSAYNIIVNDANLVTGSKFQDKSSFHHFEASYNHTFKHDINWLVGTSYRIYVPRSFGSIFYDTLVNRADTLADGSPNLKAKFVNLNTWEVGAYTQLTVDLFKQHLKLVGSARVDKSENFKVQFSPRISVIGTYKNHTLRFSYQQAFRAPTLQNQYISLDLGAIQLLGNLNGAEGYDYQSVLDFREKYDSTLSIEPGILKPIKLDPIRPEQVNSWEFGYRGVFFSKLYVDISTYFNRYFHFIGDLRYYAPDNKDIIVGSDAGADAMLTGSYNLIQMPTNAKQKVDAFGASIGLNYYIWKSLVGSFNYTYSGINTKNLTDPIIPGFNTPNHKFNIGLSADKIWKGLGFAINFKWVSKYKWESTFGDGEVPSFHTLDMQVSYEFPRWFTLQVGGSNIYNNKHIEAYGSPTIGALVYGTMLFDLERTGIESERWIKKKKNK